MKRALAKLKLKIREKILPNYKEHIEFCVIKCPVHSDVEIGVVKLIENASFDNAWYCEKCKKLWFFNEADLDKYLNSDKFYIIKD